MCFNVVVIGNNNSLFEQTIINGTKIHWEQKLFGLYIYIYMIWTNIFGTKVDWYKYTFDHFGTEGNGGGPLFIASVY